MLYSVKIVGKSVAFLQNYYNNDYYYFVQTIIVALEWNEQAYKELYNDSIKPVKPNFASFLNFSLYFETFSVEKTSGALNVGEEGEEIEGRFGFVGLSGFVHHRRTIGTTGPLVLRKCVTYSSLLLIVQSLLP